MRSPKLDGSNPGAVSVGNRSTFFRVSKPGQAKGVHDGGERFVMDNKTLKRPHDASRINLSEDYEVRYWMKEFGVGEEELKRLALKHKGSVAAIREELRR